MSRRRAQVVLICEDSQHETFVRQFLGKRGWKSRALRVEKAPAGRGSGERFVRERFPSELRELRRRHVDRAVVVIIDGDKLGPMERLGQLDDACKTAGVSPRSQTDRAAVLEHRTV